MHLHLHLLLLHLLLLLLLRGDGTFRAARRLELGSTQGRGAKRGSLDPHKRRWVRRVHHVGCGAAVLPFMLLLLLMLLQVRGHRDQGRGSVRGRG